MQYSAWHKLNRETSYANALIIWTQTKHWLVLVQSASDRESAASLIFRLRSTDLQVHTKAENPLTFFRSLRWSAERLSTFTVSPPVTLPASLRSGPPHKLLLEVVNIERQQERRSIQSIQIDFQWGQRTEDLEWHNGCRCIVG